MTYAGIGSRKTPRETLALMTFLGEWLANKGVTLYSGHADGADMAFEAGCDKANGKKKIFLPWQNFNGSDSSFYTQSDAAVEIARQYHPAWDYLSPAAKKLMARNSYQVLGEDLQSPVDFVCCFTPGGRQEGGTAQALRIARAYRIPIFNFGHFTNECEAKKCFNVFWKKIERKEE